MPRGQRSCLIHSVLPNTCHSRCAAASGRVGVMTVMTEGMRSVTPAEGGAESRPVPGKRGCSAMRCALAYGSPPCIIHSPSMDGVSATCWETKKPIRIPALPLEANTPGGAGPRFPGSVPRFLPHFPVLPHCWDTPRVWCQTDLHLLRVLSPMFITQAKPCIYEEP